MAKLRLSFFCRLFFFFFSEVLLVLSFICFLGFSGGCLGSAGL